MSNVIKLSELDTLKLSKEQLQFELFVERVQKQINEAQRKRDELLMSICGDYLPQGAKLTDYTINMDEGTLTPRPQEQ
jgi:hypothetical protein